MMYNFKYTLLQPYDIINEVKGSFYIYIFMEVSNFSKINVRGVNVYLSTLKI